jgi:hypothetical protein
MLTPILASGCHPMLGNLPGQNKLTAWTVNSGHRDTCSCLLHMLVRLTALSSAAGGIVGASRNQRLEAET